MSQYTGSIPVDVHRWKADATQRLLGYTIGISDEAWHEATPLPGWSRAHVATHLARGADQSRELIEAVLAGRPLPPAPSTVERMAALERGADRTGLELQIDLDTSAGALQQVIDRVTDWTLPVELRGETRTLDAIPLARLHELCLHHLDLDCGFSPDAIEPAPAAWLLRWVLDEVSGTELPAVRLEGDSLVAELGSVEPRRTVSGSDARLWAWLCGRLSPAAVSGADDLQPGLLS